MKEIRNFPNKVQQSKGYLRGQYFRASTKLDLSPTEKKNEREKSNCKKRNDMRKSSKKTKNIYT